VTRPALLAAALALAGCDERPAAPEPAAPQDTRPPMLKVPLAPGWRATPIAGGIVIGPPGRDVLQLEKSSRRFPDPALFFAAVEAEGVKVLQKESLDTFLGVRYSFDDKEAFLGVRDLGPVTVWCSSLPGADAASVEAGLTVCRSLTWPADAAAE
jgi:hypothetical protein